MQTIYTHGPNCPKDCPCGLLDRESFVFDAGDDGLISVDAPGLWRTLVYEDQRGCRYKVRRVR